MNVAHLRTRTNASGGERLDNNVGSFISGHGLVSFLGLALVCRTKKYNV